MNGLAKGKVYDIQADGTVIITTTTNTSSLIHQKVKECYISFIDSRPLSDKQRRMCYALIGAISEWSGSSVDDIKTAFKLEFWAGEVDTIADKIFSLSNAPMSLVAEFQRFLVGFIISNGVPTKRPLLEYVDDVENYTYLCLIHKKCAVCGRRADLHHVDAIGMGNDRTAVTHLGREVISLCREHHTEIHSIGKAEFMAKYHLDGGIEADKTILKIYGLRR